MCIFKYKHFDELFCLYNKVGTETISHVENVSKIMNIFVSHLKTIDKYSELIKFDTNMLVTASLLHDIGKINIPIDIFIKLADYYDVTIDYLVGRSKDKK